MKKLLFLLVCVVLLASLPLTVFAEAEVAVGFERAMRTAYMNCPEFQDHMAADPEGAIAALDYAIETILTIEAANEKKLIDKICDEIRMNPVKEIEKDVGTRAVYGDYYAWVSTSLVTQINSYYCAPASALMAITGWGGHVQGNTNYQKQVTLGAQMQITSAGPIVWWVNHTINSYLNSRNYSYFLGKYMPGASFRAITFHSLVHDRAPLLHARTIHLPYYDYNTGHYITVTAYNYNTGQMRLHDPHYNNKYGGIHWVSWIHAYNSIEKEPGRYLIAHW